MANDHEANQGCINSHMARLLGQPDKLAEYAATLTEKQRDLARSHLKTILQLQKAAKNNVKNNRKR